jgi:hypothetical protein
MAMSTATTTLKYATSSALQIETATVVGTITQAGNATVIVTGRDISGSPITNQVAVALDDTASQVAEKIRVELSLLPDITNVYTVGGTTSDVILTKLVATNDDTTLNISVDNGTCTGITTALTSVDTLAGGTYLSLVAINSYPDMGSTPSKLDTTDMAQSTYKTSILGLQEVPDLTFECNYDETIFNTINSLNASNYFFQLVFGIADGKFDWQGQVKIYAMGGGVDEVRKMTVTLSASTPLVFGVVA